MFATVFIRVVSPTTLLLIRPIGTVSLPITQEGLWNTASVVIAAMMAALTRSRTVRFIRLVLAVVLPVTQLSLRDASISVRTLELP